MAVTGFTGTNAETYSYEADGVTYDVWHFRAVGTITLDAPVDADVLVVGGGGAGSATVDQSRSAGGGGGGGRVVPLSMTIAAGEHTLQVGRGGIGVAGLSTEAGESGFDTVAFGQTAPGGGAGAAQDQPGIDGGSGGGVRRGGGAIDYGGDPVPGTPEAGYGYEGGHSFDTRNASGGGGAGGPGGDCEGKGYDYPAGDGGPAYFSDITGTLLGYGAGGGGGGGDDGIAGAGGDGGGGRGGGGHAQQIPTDGVRGAGGGGGSWMDGVAAGSGGDGEVIIRVARVAASYIDVTADITISGTVEAAGFYTYAIVYVDTFAECPFTVTPAYDDINVFTLYLDAFTDFSLTTTVVGENLQSLVLYVDAFAAMDFGTAFEGIGARAINPEDLFVNVYSDITVTIEVSLFAIPRFFWDYVADPYEEEWSALPPSGGIVWTEQAD